MIKYITGDLFQDNSQAIVNTVNCVGVMGVIRNSNKGDRLDTPKRYCNLSYCFLTKGTGPIRQKGIAIYKGDRSDKPKSPCNLSHCFLI